MSDSLPGVLGRFADLVRPGMVFKIKETEAASGSSSDFMLVALNGDSAIAGAIPGAPARPNDAGVIVVNRESLSRAAQKFHTQLSEILSKPANCAQDKGHWWVLLSYNEDISYACTVCDLGLDEDMKPS